MKVLLRTVESPTAPVTERLLEVPVLKIGRGTDQDLVLGDLRVALAHAELLPHTSMLGTSVRLEAKSRLGVKVNGTPEQRVTLKIGDVMEFGRYALTVGKHSEGRALVLTLTQRVGQQEERDQRKAAFKTSLKDTGWSRRRLSWLLFGLVALTALGLPLLRYFTEPPAVIAADRSTLPQRALKADIVWNSGPLSNAHTALSADCGLCHQEPFVRVQDSSCKGCHTTLGDHAMTVQVAAQHPFGEQRCTDCHREHNGPHGLIPTANSACTSCHAEPSSLPGKPGLAAGNFSTAHPAFLLKLARAAPAGSKQAFVWTQVRQGTPEAKHQDTGLKFPHDVHLSKKGIDAPEGKRRLDCGSCHKADAEKASFLPVTMERDCADCHRLDFNPQAPERLLPHGEPQAVVQSVRDHYARIALAGGVLTAGAPTVVRERRRPGETLPRASAQAALAWADHEAEKTLTDVFEKRTCFVCHDVQRVKGETLSWQIAPVAAQKPAFSTLTFPHGAHVTEPCSSCHASAGSKHSEDVMLPDIGQCRDCHGDTGAMTETASPCQSCHVYHRPQLTVTPPPAIRPAVAAKSAP